MRLAITPWITGSQRLPDGLLHIVAFDSVISVCIETPPQKKRSFALPAVLPTEQPGQAPELCRAREGRAGQGSHPAVPGIDGLDEREDVAQPLFRVLVLRARLGHAPAE